jgi:ubiquinone/menaquinone biosynthesis C-methylase UbiE
VRADVLEGAKELRKISNAFRQARVLISANNYRIFDHLRRFQSAESISGKLSIDCRATEILLDALTGLGLLTKQKHRYRNADISSQLLMSGSPYYQGDIICHADSLWRSWSGLDDVIKTGRPVRVARDQKAFILGMHNLASLKAKNIVRKIGLRGVKTALDLGGGPGTYSIEMARRGVKVTLFDLPETIAIAKKVIKKEKMACISFIKGNFLSDDIGDGYDLIFISQILHSFSEKKNLGILKKCKDSLNKGGRIVIQEFYIDEDRTHPAQNALFSVNMLVNTDGGRCYSPGEIKEWLLKSGLKVLGETLLEDTILITGGRRGCRESIRQIEL